MLEPNWEIKLTKNDSKSDKFVPYQMVKLSQDKLSLSKITKLINHQKVHNESEHDYYAMGDSNLQSQDYLGAICDYSIAIKQNPDNKSLYK